VKRADVPSSTACQYKDSGVWDVFPILRHITACAALQAVLSQYKDELVDDPLINSHLSSLYDTLLEQNLVSSHGCNR
jgi:hypothetical protein